MLSTSRGGSGQVYWWAPGTSRRLIPHAAFSGSLSGPQFMQGRLAGAAVQEQAVAQIGVPVKKIRLVKEK